ncbi:MAG TPA: HAMP domain-containing sensor histidine kinase [Patescibacteria group bacterium]|nr:HAMP domain-containing sensor histidine kinase [Patescibacteria group bacterium]
MAFHPIDALRRLKIKYKIFLILAILFILIVNLGILNITSIRDIRVETQQISSQFVPRLLETTAIRDRVNESIIYAYDYVHTGNTESKQQYQQNIQQALQAEVQLFFLAQTDTEFEFATLFQQHLNDVGNSLKELIASYESGADKTTMQKQLAAVATNQQAFSTFLQKEIETKLSDESAREQYLSNQQIRRVGITVSIIGSIALIALLFVYIFTHRSITSPIKKLTTVAEGITHGKFQPANIESRDELGIFAETFNTMIQKLLATQESLTIELEKTKKLDQQKSEFLSIAAHQLRTPMSGIKWLISMAAEGDLGPVNDEAKKQLKKGLENVNRMIALINSLLDVSQIETGKLQYVLKEQDIVPIATQACDDLEFLSKQMGVAIEIQKPKKALPFVSVDAEKIKIAFHNIVDNAIRYTPKGGTVSINFKKDVNEILMNITDTGYGIPKEEQKRIFTKMYRGSNIQTIQADGSGLGLYIANEIVKQHEGEITFTSKQNKGTTFTIALPIA